MGSNACWLLGLIVKESVVSLKEILKSYPSNWIYRLFKKKGSYMSSGIME